MNSFWSWYITIIVVANILACWWLIRWTAKPRPGEAAQDETTGHVWDENLSEYNKPMPRWWLWMFYISIVFSLIYLILYPGLGRYPGVLNWSAETAYATEREQAETRYAPLFAAYAEREITELATDREAMQTAHRLFGNNCAVCHGADGGGAPGFPSLTNNEWLYGGSPEAIKHSIMHGRQGFMPPMGGVLGERGVDEIATYVYSLNGRSAPDRLVNAGRAKFQQHCAVCHAADGTGNKALGAPNLTTENWVYGGSLEAIRASIRDGRSGDMPGQQALLGEDRVHLLAAYVYSLSAERDTEQE
ncbi:cytochrome-c oxidase, cbb3-type subunit III [Alkalilimnicola ehrlichii]|uniref:Cbb3-type cytochrome c oxidase subunit n=1 Tax=Alkalilimnicola ehrlichii TaxID=351052 RepID=A0A3E0X1W7_9GAMM|nr:cytochrome-c oxidase, cbb3-type subunit III [Alkalilimnicola ehrlichii]RFA31246.1 cytochrome-c oxidase, cbb3-type subunit III [Alkalilimnicola ehrlichii]RFA39477.1 cytochrome-c oxidase, cbb3-type subunit III [Alkalilimnicola ehrlichii]